MGNSVCLSIILLSGLVFSPLSYSHARWDPNGLVKPRTADTDGKVAPCGGFAKTNKPTVLQAGATIEVAFESNIFHKGFFRIAFSAANDQNFDSLILAENIRDISGQRYRTYSIKLPDIECTGCTLQLIQSMLDRSPPTNYYSCADIQLVKKTVPDLMAPSPITQLLLVANDTQVELSWTNPAEQDLAGVFILEDTQPITQKPVKGTRYQLQDSLGSAKVINAGPKTTINLPNRTPEKTYYYALSAFDTSLNYSAITSESIFLPNNNPNIAPTVQLRMEQNRSDSTAIKTDGGRVIVQADVSDFNPTDSHTISWEVNNNLMTNLSTEPAQFIFDPAALPPGNYAIEATAVDNGTPPLSANATIHLTLTQPEPIRLGALGEMWLWLLFACLMRCLIRPVLAFFVRKKVLNHKVKL
ncbi:MAG: SCE4755 family polysaccharide monooxygenase-like protein [Marinagarivorans sp.]|nr:SCE4755 family polysaccharide monooxygenase-like protein [Marinagarivorans sp.]